ncbi:MAG: nitroreductase family protein [Myxococcales bacterium]|nr:nitroreductase family protein [Myxococcales bacterium]
MHASSPAHILRGAVACAIRAPSSHNTQPWRFRRRGEVLELWLDRTRHLEIVDPLRRQLVISCGCALYNARVAIRAEGFIDKVVLQPRPDEPDLVAELRLGLPREATNDDRDLVAAIPRRHTNRRPFLDRPVGAETAEVLAHASRAERTRMFRLSPQRKQEMAALVAECDRRRFADPAYRAQVGEWLVPGGRLRKDGIPFAEKEYGTSTWFGMKRALATPGLGEHVAALEGARVMGAPMVAVLATQADEDIDWIDCGQALEAVLLRATHLGLAAAFVDQLLEYEDLHEQVKAMIGTELIPQMVVRLGYTPPLERVAPRRDLADVFEEHD